MENNDWNVILSSLKGMFDFDDDILWSVYFNCKMNLDKTIDTLIELSEEQKKVVSFDAISSKMITFDDLQEENKTTVFLNKVKNSLSSLTKRNNKYNKINNDSDD